MKKIVLMLTVLLTGASLLSLGCMDRTPAPVCPVPTELQSSEAHVTSLEGVDILVVVDNSNSMEEEQAMLATAFFPLVNSLMNPIDATSTIKKGDVNDIRIAITTSDMGLSSAGNPYNQASDGFPIADPKCANPLGDNGAFIDDYLGGAVVSIQEGVIPCDSAVQCPPAWTCENVNAEGVGTCVSGGVTDVSCSAPSPKSASMTYLEVNDDIASPNWTSDNLALATACMANVGREGCGFEQQLMAASASVNGPGLAGTDETRFMREKSLLTILIVSDEEDCSMKDGPGLFATDEVQKYDYTKINIACGMHPEFLYEPKDLKEKYEAAKAQVSGAAAAKASILFAAIVGVPAVDACQGKGTELTDCLDATLVNGGTMGNPQTEDRLQATGGTATYYEYACQRFADDGTTLLTGAQPGTRYVEMARLYGNLSYVYSICNPDWSPAMEEIASLIAENMNSSCYDKRLSWDATTRTANCNVVSTFSGTTCPAGVKWADEGKDVTAKGSDQKVIACTLPKLELPIDCAEASDQIEAYKANDFGWFYCENDATGAENFADACGDNEDNDGNGKTDCEDESCHYCKGCSDTVDVGECPLKCKYDLSFTKSARDLIGTALSTDINCLQQFKFEDPNCQENSAKVCGDNLDNDGNGPYDCNEVTFDEATKDDPAHNAEPACCPMSGEAGTTCNLDLDGNKKEDWTENCSGKSRPAACIEHAKALGCLLP
ncbi:MAG: hypothetical protein JXR91_09115 [Deltaproteobacteria bacterium]|nr:hypothetical protein [Deltaproteobacteria bacterium]